MFCYINYDNCETHIFVIVVIKTKEMDRSTDCNGKFLSESVSSTSKIQLQHNATYLCSLISVDPHPQ